jgi:hypothetical protein
VIREAVVSVHDVTPETLDRVGRILALLAEHRVSSVDLLVVAGRRWEGEPLERLRGWVEEGHVLAGHGWSHQAPPPRTLHHRLHARFLSRDQAEHLSRDREELLERVRRCHGWFAQVGLPSPRLYVPPAWALGTLTRDDLRELPFDWYETLTGLMDATRGHLRLLPLVGYEADNPARRRGLRISNALNRRAARLLGRPVRMAIHPYDLELLLARDFRRDLEHPFRARVAGDVLAPGEEAGHRVLGTPPSATGP